MKTNRLGIEEVRELKNSYPGEVINYAYGLRLLEVCLERAVAGHAESVGFSEFIEHLDDVSQSVNEGFEYISRYISASEDSESTREDDPWDRQEKVSISGLVGLMREVAEGLENTLDNYPEISGDADLDDSQLELLDEGVHSAWEKIRSVGYETYHYLIGADFVDALLSSSSEKSPDVPETDELPTFEDRAPDGNHENLELKANGSKSQAPSRYRIARADASVAGIKANIEKVFGLPAGSVSLCGPNNKPLRADAKIATLRKRWKLYLQED